MRQSLQFAVHCISMYTASSPPHGPISWGRYCPLAHSRGLGQKLIHSTDFQVWQLKYACNQ